MRSSPSSVVGQFCHISPLAADVAAPSQMQGLNAIVLETHIAILIIDRRCYQHDPETAHQKGTEIRAFYK